MDIDLLFTKEGEAGLICNQNLIKKAIGVTFDQETGLMGIEYADMDQLELNITIDSHFWPALDYCTNLHIGSIKNGNIAQAYQIPLMLLSDPYRGEKLGKTRQHHKPLEAFNAFIKRCSIGQPVHREDLGNEDAQGCVLGDASPAALQFAPHLARQHAVEIRPEAAPNVPGFSVPGLGGGSSSSSSTYYQRRSDNDDKE